MITEYVKAVNFGNGFITHEDSEIMTFADQGYNLWKVIGNTEDISVWVARVGGTIIEVR
jgi:hypothetical protein